MYRIRFGDHYTDVETEQARDTIVSSLVGIGYAEREGDESGPRVFVEVREETSDVTEKLLSWIESMKSEAFDRAQPDGEGDPGDPTLQNFLIDHQPDGFGLEEAREAVARKKAGA